MLENLSTKLNRISETARQNPTYRFDNLAHLVNPEMMTWAFDELRKKAAPGVDGVTIADYKKDLAKNLKSLHAKMTGGSYRAQPMRRSYIEKEDGKQRPLSIPATEDKIVQKAVGTILSKIYENDFMPTSFGYRPGKNAHQAIEAIRDHIIRGNVNYVLDADIRNYFGTIVRKELMEMLKKRVTDANLLRLIGKWLNAGAIDDGQLLLDEDGVAQGSVISPILANLYLHEVLDLWIERDVKPHMRGQIKFFRYADDFIVCFAYKEDAERFTAVLVKRFAKYGLTIAEEKTKLIEFGRRSYWHGMMNGKKPNTFNFLGFTFYCGETRNRKYTVKVKTMGKRFKRSLMRVSDWCQRNRHLSVQEQWKHLCRVMNGHYQYYGFTFNSERLGDYHHWVEIIWHRWLSRRHRGSPMVWEKYKALLKKYPLPRPCIRHGWKGNQATAS